MYDGFKYFRPLQRGEFIVAFVDPSFGGGDNTAGQFISQKWLDQPMVYHSNVTITAATPIIHLELVRIHKETGIEPIVAFENNNGGSFEMERLAQLNRYGDYRIYTMKQIDPTGRLVDTGRIGWDTNSATRPKMLRELKNGVESELLHIYHRKTLDELFSFIISPTGKPEAEQGAHDDLVMALAGAWQLCQTETAMKEQGGGVVETDDSHGYYKEAGTLIVEEGYNEY